MSRFCVFLDVRYFVLVFIIDSLIFSGIKGQGQADGMDWDQHLETKLSTFDQLRLNIV
jgi:hypothetical protein